LKLSIDSSVYSRANGVCLMVVTKLVHFSYIIVILHTVVQKMLNKDNRAQVVLSDDSVVVVTEVVYVNYF